MAFSIGGSSFVRGIKLLWYWFFRAQLVKADRLDAKILPTATTTATSEKTKSVNLKHAHASTMTNLMNAVILRDILPSMLAYNLGRGIVHAGQVALKFAFMLAAM